MPSRTLPRVALAAAIALLPPAGLAAQQQPPACNTPVHAQLDFWVGTWELSWGDSARGRNVITRTHDGCVVEEHFDGLTSSPLRGHSVSMWDRATGTWRQVWVDNQGAWLDFTGGPAGERFAFEREAVVRGQPVRQRMVWFDITPDSLHWNWEQSRDDGATWQVQWAITYRRVP